MKKLLEELMNTPSPSGYEEMCINVWDKWMGENTHCTKEYEDKIGNSGWSIGNGPIKILLSAHIDEVNSRVQSISESGMISFINTGGMDKKSLIGSEVLILGDKGAIKGVVEKKALHCESDEEYESSGKIKDFRINVGAESKEEVEELGIYPGACIVYERRAIIDFGKNQVCGCGLDDKVGVYIVSQIMKNLGEANMKKYTIIGLSGVQEETGLRGLTIASKNINPDISIDFDVTFSTDGDLGISKEEYGDVVLGKGGVLEYGADKSRRIAGILKDIAKTENIKFQTAASRNGGTNTDAIQLNSKDCETMLISIPNRSMHSPVEVCDWRDIESIIEMVTKAIVSEKL